MIPAGDLLTAVEAPKLSPLELRLFFSRLSYPWPLSPEDTLISHDDALRYWVQLLLRQIPFLTAPQIELIRAELHDDLTSVGDRFMREVTPEPFLLLFQDGQLVTWTGRTGWLSLQDGSLVIEPTPALESVAYNLRQLFARNMHAVQRYQRYGTKDSTDADPDAENPA